MYRKLRSLVLHLLQDGHNHVKLGSFGWVFVHAEPHHLADMRWDSRWNCRPKTFQSHLSNQTDFKMPYWPDIYRPLAIWFRSASTCTLMLMQSISPWAHKQQQLTFIPISMCDRSAKGTSRVTNSHSKTAKLHMSADLLLMSSGFFCKPGNKKTETYSQ